MFVEGAFLIPIVAFYFIPTIVAAVRHAPDIGAVILINLFLGWTLIGWIVALGMATRTAKPPHSHPSPLPAPPMPPSEQG